MPFLLSDTQGPHAILQFIKLLTMLLYSDLFPPAQTQAKSYLFRSPPNQRTSNPHYSGVMKCSYFIIQISFSFVFSKREKKEKAR